MQTGSVCLVVKGHPCISKGAYWALADYQAHCHRIHPLDRTDTLKFFGCELGAQTKFEKASGTSIVNGAHDASRLSELLESFIKK